MTEFNSYSLVLKLEDARFPNGVKRLFETTQHQTPVLLLVAGRATLLNIQFIIPRIDRFFHSLSIYFILF